MKGHHSDSIVLDRPRHGSVLEPTGNEVAEREAIADEPRAGVWAGEQGADLRLLTQEQTEALIRAELVRLVTPGERAEVIGAVGGAQPTVWLAIGTGVRHPAVCQRGGLDTDPLVRLLAFRAWGDRDRLWFEDRGVRRGDPVTSFGTHDVYCAWPGERVIGTATADARPGEITSISRNGAVQQLRVGKRLRIKPARL